MTRSPIAENAAVAAAVVAVRLGGGASRMLPLSQKQPAAAAAGMVVVEVVGGSKKRAPPPLKMQPAATAALVVTERVGGGGERASPRNNSCDRGRLRFWWWQGWQG